MLTCNMKFFKGLMICFINIVPAISNIIIINAAESEQWSMEEQDVTIKKSVSSLFQQMGITSDQISILHTGKENGGVILIKNEDMGFTYHIAKDEKKNKKIYLLWYDRFVRINPDGKGCLWAQFLINYQNNEIFLGNISLKKISGESYSKPKDCDDVDERIVRFMTYKNELPHPKVITDANVIENHCFEKRYIILPPNDQALQQQLSKSRALRLMKSGNRSPEEPLKIVVKLRTPHEERLPSSLAGTAAVDTATSPPIQHTTTTETKEEPLPVAPLIVPMSTKEKEPSLPVKTVETIDVTVTSPSIKHTTTTETKEEPLPIVSKVSIAKTPISTTVNTTIDMPLVTLPNTPSNTKTIQVDMSYLASCMLKIINKNYNFAQEEFDILLAIAQYTKLSILDLLFNNKTLDSKYIPSDQLVTILETKASTLNQLLTNQKALTCLKIINNKYIGSVNVLDAHKICQMTEIDTCMQIPPSILTTQEQARQLTLLLLHLVQYGKDEVIPSEQLKFTTTLARLVFSHIKHDAKQHCWYNPQTQQIQQDKLSVIGDNIKRAQANHLWGKTVIECIRETA